jgi:hypothetical protein
VKRHSDAFEDQILDRWLAHIVQAMVVSPEKVCRALRSKGMAGLDFFSGHGRVALMSHASTTQKEESRQGTPLV